MVGGGGMGGGPGEKLHSRAATLWSPPEMGITSSTMAPSRPGSLRNSAWRPQPNAPTTASMRWSPDDAGEIGKIALLFCWERLLFRWDQCYNNRPILEPRFWGHGLPYCFDDHELDPERRELRRRGAALAVEPLVFDILTYLVENRERVVSKEDLHAAVWGGRIVSESTLSSCMTTVRGVVGDNGEAQRLI